MSRQLTKHRFKESDLDLPEVQNFTCGRKPWEVEVAVWIKSRSGDNSVLEDIEQFGTEVWLYRAEEGELVGYASLGANKWSVPMPQGPKQIISYIPFVGVHQTFQGEPKEAGRDDKFAYQILDDLIEHAAGKRDRQPYIGLSVDRRNDRAIKFYQYRGFEDVKSPHTDKITKVVYERMLLNIAALVEPSTPPV
jgi:ribosomal protein S18 acetylase RimI-like enzyme